MRFRYWMVGCVVLFITNGGCRKNSDPQGPGDASNTGPGQPTNTAMVTKGTNTSTPGDPGNPGANGRPPNVLLLIADDLGMDVLGLNGFTSTPALTPNLDKLAASGLVFDNFWVTPACTTTRGAIISGQHGFLSGIDFVPALMPDSTLTIQQRLKAVQPSYATGVFGKWHLGGRDADVQHPARFGVDLYQGNLFNLDDYNNWTLTQNGQQSESTTYHTTQVVDLARDFIASKSAQPWFAWVAFVAPHAPFHTPPANLITQAPNDTAPSQYRAMVEAMDTEIGRLVGAMSPETLSNTLIIFLGDNGTPPKARDREVFAQDHVKSSIYEGGIRAPLIVSGGLVKRKGERDAALVNATDIFATVVDLASAGTVPTDLPAHSVSFASLLSSAGSSAREYNYSEWKSNGELSWAVRDATHKAIQFPDGSTALYATSDISETTPLDDAAILARLLKWGEDLRKGDTSPGGTPELSPFCTQFAGTRSHQGLDVGRNTSMSGTVTIRENGGFCDLSTNGIPDHEFNDATPAFRNPVSEQTFELKVPLAPQASQASTPLTLDTDNGILLNGAKIDLLAAACYGVEDGKIGCNDMTQPWRYDPVFAANGFGVDGALAHTQPSGAYHYHGVGPVAQRTGVIGVAADGFSIHSQSIVIQGVQRTLRSSYRLRQGSRVQTSQTAPFPGGAYDGTYRDDYEYVPGLGDLDECNGATINGQYMYFATQAYPYYLGCFRGTPDPSFKKRGPRARHEHAHGLGFHVHD